MRCGPRGYRILAGWTAQLLQPSDSQPLQLPQPAQPANPAAFAASLHMGHNRPNCGKNPGTGCDTYLGNGTVSVSDSLSISVGEQTGN